MLKLLIRKVTLLNHSLSYSFAHLLSRVLLATLLNEMNKLLTQSIMASSVETTWVKRHVGPTASVLIPQHGTAGVAHWSIEDESVFAENKKVAVSIPRRNESKVPPSVPPPSLEKELSPSKSKVGALIYLCTKYFTNELSVSRCPR